MTDPTRGMGMILERYYIECLSQASYLIGDETTGLAVVVEPRRGIDDNLADAARYGLRIEGVSNTHFHANFVSRTTFAAA
jgi:hydroxyacylglutathione hydrolase